MNLFQHLYLKNRPSLSSKIMNPSFEERSFVPTLRAQVLRSWKDQHLDPETSSGWQSERHVRRRDWYDSGCRFWKRNNSSSELVSASRSWELLYACYRRCELLLAVKGPLYSARTISSKWCQVCWHVAVPKTWGVSCQRWSNWITSTNNNSYSFCPFDNPCACHHLWLQFKNNLSEVVAR